MKSEVRKANMNRFFRIAFVALLTLLAAAVGVVWASLPTQNPAGATLVRVSAEVWAGTSQVNGAGSNFHLAAGLSTSADTTNPQGSRAYIGHLDPVTLPPSTRADSIWLSVE